PCGRGERSDTGETDRHRLASLAAPLLRFTSRTTSKAKGVIIPQSSMLEYTRRFTSVYALQRGDCILNLLSMAHIFYQVTAGMLGPFCENFLLGGQTRNRDKEFQL